MGRALEVRDVSYRHKGAARLALDGLRFHIEEGAITGLLGPNGAGKTTFVSLLCGILAPQQGDILVRGIGHRSREARATIGYCPQDLALYTTLSAAENLRFFGKMAGLSGTHLEHRIHWCLESVRLSDARDQRVEEFSGGMQRRLNLATALVHGPRLLVLDEPTVGVDMQSRLAIFETLEDLARGGTAIMYTTHYMEEVERLCRNVVVIDHGRVLASCATGELLSSGLNVHTFSMTCTEDAGAQVASELRSQGFNVTGEGPTVVVGDPSLERILRAIAELSGREGVLAVESKQPTLEERFLKLTEEGRP